MHWSAAEDSLDKTEDTPDRANVEKTQAMSVVQPIPPEILKMLPIMPAQPTFEDRWRLR